jgi:hypothetical protein
LSIICEFENNFFVGFVGKLELCAAVAEVEESWELCCCCAAAADVEESWSFAVGEVLKSWSKRVAAKLLLLLLQRYMTRGAAFAVAEV